MSDRRDDQPNDDRDLTPEQIAALIEAELFAQLADLLEPITTNPAR